MSDFTCKLCNSFNNYVFDEGSGEIICLACGVVIAEQRNNEVFTSMGVMNLGSIDTSRSDSKGMYAVSNEILNNVGSIDGLSGYGVNIITSLMEKMDYSRLGLMSTRIYEGGEDCKGHRLEMGFRKLITTNKMTGDKYDSKKKNIGVAVNTILKISEVIPIPDFIKEEVITEYQKFLDDGNKGISAVFMAAAILYYVCQKNHYVISLQRISELLKNHSLDISSKYFKAAQGGKKPQTTNSNKDQCQKKLFKTYSTYIKIMDLPQPTVITYMLMIPEMAEKLNIREIYRRSARKLGEAITENNRTAFLGKSPKAIAVILLYYVVSKHKTPLNIETISHMTGISNVTIKKLYKDIDDCVKKYNIDYQKDIVSIL